MTEQKTHLKGVIILLLTSLIWGVSFVSQSVGAETIEPFTFMGIRTLMGATVLVPFIFVRGRMARRKLNSEQIAARNRQNAKTFIYGGIIGIFLAAATNIQQYAFTFPGANAGKIAFITAMYMFFVPIFGLFIKKRISLLTWLCIIFGFIGLYFLCFKSGESFSVNTGDIVTLACAVFFTFQILLIEKFAPECDGIKLSCVEFYTAGIITLVLMLIFDNPTWSGLRHGGIALLYSGIMSCGIAYTMQVIGQKYCEATVASLLMCMESVFAAIASAILLHEHLSGRELIGCAVMFTAIIISQISDFFKQKAVRN